MALIWIFALLAGLWLVVILPYQMAVRRRRRGWLFVLLSLVISPLIVVPLLWVIGGAPRVHGGGD